MTLYYCFHFVAINLPIKKYSKLGVSFLKWSLQSLVLIIVRQMFANRSISKSKSSRHVTSKFLIRGE